MAIGLGDLRTIGGAGVTGGGARSVDGYVRNLDVRPEELGAASVSFEWESTAPDSEHVFYLIVNGVCRGQVQPGVRNVTEPLGDGGHEVRVVAARAAGTRAPEPDAELGGRRPHVRWSWVGQRDLDGYEVGWDAGNGAATTPALLDTVTAVEVVRVREEAATSGGRVSIEGEWTLAPMNEDLLLALHDDGEGGLEWRLTSLVLGVMATGPLLGGASQLYGGLSVRWIDATEDYADGDEWTLVVRPRTWWTAESELDAGTYRFAVRSFADAGNRSAWSSWASLVVVADPLPPDSAAISWDSGTGVVTVTWADPGDATAAAVRVYTNYDATFETLSPYVDEVGYNARLTIPTAGEYTFTLPAGVRGEVLAYVRTESTGGVVERNATLLRATAAEDGPSTLSAPVVVSGAPGAGGSLVATWSMDLSAGTPTDLKFYVSTSASWDDATEIEEAAFGGVGFPVASGVWTSPGDYGDVGNRWVGVRAVDASGNLTAAGALYGPIEGDDTAPDVPTISSVGVT